MKSDFTPIKKIDIAIPTFRRPELLRGLLDSLSAQNPLGDIAVRVIVIDNDPNGTARPVCVTHPVEPIYGTELMPGVSAARNTAVSLSDADAIVFIDDDEIADPDWLSELVAVAVRYGAQVVGGPVIPLFPPDAPKWARAQGWFERPNYRTGDPVRWPATNNVLIRRSLLDELGPTPFDLRYSLTGGEDADLFDRARRMNAIMVWASKAIVFETVPHSRMTASWVWRRYRRLGSTSATLMLRDRSRMFVAAVSIARIVCGATAGSLMLIVRQRAVGKTLGQFPRGIGALSALAGHQIEEYRRAAATGLAKR